MDTRNNNFLAWICLSLKREVSLHYCLSQIKRHYYDTVVEQEYYSRVSACPRVNKSRAILLATCPTVVVRYKYPDARNIDICRAGVSPDQVFRPEQMDWCMANKYVGYWQTHSHKHGKMDQRQQMPQEIAVERNSHVIPSVCPQKVFWLSKQFGLMRWKNKLIH